MSQETRVPFARRCAAFWLGLMVFARVVAGATNTPPAAPAGPPTHARVVVVEAPGAMLAFDPQFDVIRPMIDRGLTNLTGKLTPLEAWRSLVSTQDTVGLKVVSAPGPTSGTRLPVVEAVVQGLLNSGLPPKQIVVWDKHLAMLRLAGFTLLAERYGVRLAGSQDEGYDPEQSYAADGQPLGRLVAGDLEFGVKEDRLGHKSYVSKLITRQLTRIINITPLLNHNLAGVSGNLYGLAMGSVDNTLRFAQDGTVMAKALPEICALECLGDRVALSVVDALIAQYYGEERSLLHYSTTLNQLRFSTDPVALDVLSIQELERQREAIHVPPAKANLDLYTTAELLWIGVADPRAIQVDTIR